MTTNCTRMKQSLCIGICFLWVLETLGQAFSGKTNDIKVDYTAPITATALPTIDWISPRLERSNSTEPSMNFEAEVKSGVALSSVMLEVTVMGEVRPRKVDLGSNPNHVTIRQPMRLLNGENVVKIIATNANG